MPYLVTKYTAPGHIHFSYRNMPKRSYSGNGKSSKRTRYTRPRRRRIGRARPMRGLKTNYRAVNIYRYMRETVPQTATFSIIPAANYGAMGYMSFENLQFNQLPGSSDFTNLYARYKVDKIVTTLVPIFEEVISNNGSAASSSQQLEITRVNTKWMNSDFPIAATADAQLQELAQLQCKTKSNYAAKKPITLVTVNPGVEARTVIDSTGNEVDARARSPWLALSGPNAALDVPFKHNAIIFAARVDGSSLTTDWKYRVTHKVFFRCSQVG